MALNSVILARFFLKSLSLCTESNPSKHGHCAMNPRDLPECWTLCGDSQRVPSKTKSRRVTEYFFFLFCLGLPLPAPPPPCPHLITSARHCPTWGSPSHDLSAPHCPALPGSPQALPTPIIPPSQFLSTLRQKRITLNHLSFLGPLGLRHALEVWKQKT